jgi:hypothetical protein
MGAGSEATPPGATGTEGEGKHNTKGFTKGTEKGGGRGRGEEPPAGKKKAGKKKAMHMRGRTTKAEERKIQGRREEVGTPITGGKRGNIATKHKKKTQEENNNSPIRHLQSQEERGKTPTAPHGNTQQERRQKEQETPCTYRRGRERKG